jgi:hypothetical protein
VLPEELSNQEIIREVVDFTGLRLMRVDLHPARLALMQTGTRLGGSLALPGIWRGQLAARQAPYLRGRDI